MLQSQFCLRKIDVVFYVIAVGLLAITALFAEAFAATVVSKHVDKEGSSANTALYIITLSLHWVRVSLTFGRAYSIELLRS